MAYRRYPYQYEKKIQNPVKVPTGDNDRENIKEDTVTGTIGLKSLDAIEQIPLPTQPEIAPEPKVAVQNVRGESRTFYHIFERLRIEDIILIGLIILLLSEGVYDELLLILLLYIFLF